MKRKDLRFILMILFMLLALLYRFSFERLDANKDKPSIVYQIESLEISNKEKIIGSELREQIDENIKKKRNTSKVL